ncbi:MAG: hypothetical protein JSV66_08310 [Trueperaceae bacterium]|nr:MAG: hypothetical protein JSV66_08310 [Trueperaceae bacterium]
MATLVTACPICEGLIELRDPRKGLRVECPDCQGLWMVTSVSPLKLEVALDMENETIRADPSDEWPR